MSKVFAIAFYAGVGLYLGIHTANNFVSVTERLIDWGFTSVFGAEEVDEEDDEDPVSWDI